MRFRGTLKYNNSIVITEFRRSKGYEESIFLNDIGDITSAVMYDIKEDVKYYEGNLHMYNIFSEVYDSVSNFSFSLKDIIKNGVELDSDGIKKIYHAKNSFVEKHTIEVNGELIYFKYTFNNTTVEMHYADNQNPRGKINYKLFASENSVNVKSNLYNVRPVSEIRQMLQLNWLRFPEDVKGGEPCKNYVVLDEIQQLKDIVEFLKKFKGAIAFDTETSGLKINRLPLTHPQRDQLVGICMSWMEDTAIYIPLQMNLIENLPILESISLLKPILENKHIVTHNGKFDYKVMMPYNIRLNICDDTYIIHYIINPANGKASKGLKSLTSRYFTNCDQIEITDNFYDTSSWNFADLPYENVRAYACADADFTLKIFNLTRHKIPKMSEMIYGEEIKHMEVLAHMEYYGNKLDMDLMKLANLQTLKDLEVLKRFFYLFSGETESTLKITSHVQLRELLYTKLGYPTEVFMKDDPNTPSTDKKALKVLSEKENKSGIRYIDYDIMSPCVDENNNETGEKKLLFTADEINACACPVALILREYNKLFKWQTSFFKRYEIDNLDGFLFASFNQAGTDTGRLSSNNPNMQQLTGDWKKLIVPYDTDHYMIIFDYKQIELRIMMAMAKDKKLVEMLHNPEADIHRIVAAILLGCEPHEVSDKERKRMKAANFGIPYAMGLFALASMLAGYPVTKEKIESAKQLRSEYLDGMPLVRDMFEDFRDFACIHEFVTTYFKRIRIFEGLSTCTDDIKIHSDRRKAGNSPIQGTSADIIKIGMNRLFERFMATKPGIRITCSVHDEGMLIIPKKYHPYTVIKDIKDCMEKYFADFFKRNGDEFPPLFTGIAVVENWGDGKDDRYEIPVRLADEIARKVENNEELPIYEGSYKQIMLQEISDYLDTRHEQYIAELGFDINNLDNNSVKALAEIYHDIYLAPKMLDFYGVKGKKGAEGLVLAITNYIKSYKGYDITDVDTTNLNFVSNFEGSDNSMPRELEEYLYDQWETDEEGDNEIVVDIQHLKQQKLDEENEALRLSTNKYNVLLIGRNCVVDITNLPKSIFSELDYYLQSNNNERGRYTVIYKNSNTEHVTNIKLSYIDRDKIDSFYTQNQPKIT